MFNELIIDQTTMQATGIQVRIGVRKPPPQFHLEDTRSSSLGLAGISTEVPLLCSSSQIGYRAMGGTIAINREI